MLTGAVAVLAVCPAASRADLPELANYQVPMGKPAASAEEALSTLPNRIKEVINWNACANEIHFLNEEKRLNDEGKPNGDILPYVLAKVAWISEHGLNQHCSATVEHFGGLNKDELNTLFRERFPGPSMGEINAPDACTGILDEVSPSKIPNALTLRFKVSGLCMRQQINHTLSRRAEFGQVGNAGTSGLPCRVVGDAGHGDWDMGVIGFVRILYVDKLRNADSFNPGVRDDVIRNLLTISGPLEPESYGLFQCGNTEHDKGAPQDRADERAFYNDGFFDDLGDLFGWFINFLIVAAVVAAALLAVFVLLGPAAAGLATIVAGSLLVSLHQFRIPETENHLLMINSSRYLTNQLIIDALPDDDDKEWFKDDQEEIREWLLQRFRRLIREDFIEYNSKPYNRLSIAAILNIHDFAEDRELREGARIVLEFASAKFAAGSNQARRFVPFRRLMEANRIEIWGPSSEGLKPRRVFDLEGGGTDHLTAAMLLFTGQTQQLKRIVSGGGEFTSSQWYTSIGSASQMIWEATSSFVPHEIVLDLAINKSVPYDQRIHHDGFEIYSSGRGYLVTAGGVQTGFSYGVLLTPAQFETDSPFNFKQKPEDRGSAMPTTLMPASRPVSNGDLQHRIRDFLRIEGSFREWDHGDRDKTFATNSECETDPGKAGNDKCKRNVTYDHNLCVRKGFACGSNFVVPDALQACLTALPGANDAWRFIDSEACDPYKGAPSFFVVVFRRPCPAETEHCQTDWGFFEAVDKPMGLSFQQFMQQTIERNPQALITLPASMVGTYRSWRDETITYNALAHVQDDDESGISGVNNLDQPDIDDWPLAEGDAITADGNGRMTIRSPARQPAPNRVMRLEIDFTDWEHPKYEPLP
jgi:hypothetical protein